MSTYLRRGRLGLCVLAAASLILVGCSTSEQDSISKVPNATSAAGKADSATTSGEEGDSLSSTSESETNSDAADSSETSTASDSAGESESKSANATESESAKDTESESAKSTESESAKSTESESAKSTESESAKSTESDSAKTETDKESDSGQGSDATKEPQDDKKSSTDAGKKSESDKKSAKESESNSDKKSTKDADTAGSGKDKTKDSDSSKTSAAKDSRKDAAAAISIDDAFVKAADDKTDSTAVFGTLVNNTGKPIIITGFEANVEASKFEIHEVVGGKMQVKKSGITIPAGGSYELKPGGDHFMVSGLKKPVKAGDKIDVTIKVQNGKTIELKDVKVRTTASGEEKYDNKRSSK